MATVVIPPTVERAVSSLRPNDYNNNIHTTGSLDLLRKSIIEDGFTQPIVVQRDTGIIIDGEHRWRVVTELGWEKVPCVELDLTPVQMRIATVRHNRARGSEQGDLLLALLRTLASTEEPDTIREDLMLSDHEVTAMVGSPVAPSIEHEMAPSLPEERTFKVDVTFLGEEAALAHKVFGHAPAEVIMRHALGIT